MLIDVALLKRCFPIDMSLHCAPWRTEVRNGAPDHRMVLSGNRARQRVGFKGRRWRPTPGVDDGQIFIHSLLKMDGPNQSRVLTVAIHNSHHLPPNINQKPPQDSTYYPENAKQDSTNPKISHPPVLASSHLKSQYLIDLFWVCPVGAARSAAERL